MTDKSVARMEPLLPSQWDQQAMEALAAFPKGLDFVLSRWRAGGEDARGMHVLGSLALHPRLAKAFLTFNAYVAGDSTLPARWREIAILRISWLRRVEYEFVQHVILGKRAGLTAEDIERVQQGPQAEGWQSPEGDILHAVDELYGAGRISDVTWWYLTGVLTGQQVMDLIFLVGCYDMLGTAIRSFDLQLEPGVASLEPGLRARMLDQSGLAR